MLYAGVEPLLPTTCIEQAQVVMGANERLEAALERAWEAYRPELILVILTCATGHDRRRRRRAAGGIRAAHRQARPAL